MATIIEAVATSHAHSMPPFTKRARELADEAARRCFKLSEHGPDDVDLLINAGIYREDDLAEPALAAMIQEDINANLGHPIVTDHHGTFSFDIDNGGAGALTALQLLDGFLRSRTISVGMLVTSDVPPRRSIHFPFGSTSAAALVHSVDGERGFVDFAFETFHEVANSFSSEIAWHPREHHTPLLSPGNNEVEVYESADFACFAFDCAAHVTKTFLDRQNLTPRDLDLVLTSQYPRNFPEALSERLNLHGDRVVRSPVDGTHTAGVLFALEHALQTGRFFRAKNVLFVVVGAGITVGTALYRL